MDKEKKENNEIKDNKKISVKDNVKEQKKTTAIKTDVAHNFDSAINILENQQQRKERKQIKINLKVIKSILQSLYLFYNRQKSFNLIYFGKINIKCNYDYLFSIDDAIKKIKKSDNSYFKKNETLFTNYERLTEIIKNIENKLNENITELSEITIKIEFEQSNEINRQNQNIYNINCFYNISNKKFKDENVLINGLTNGFYHLLCETKDKSNYVEIPKNPYSISNNGISLELESFYNLKYEKKNINNNNSIIFADESTTNNTIFQNINHETIIRYSKYQVISYMKTIGNHENSAEMVINLSNGCYASCGVDKKIIIYDNNFVQKLLIEDFDDWIYKITEYDNQIMVCSFGNIFLVNIDFDDFSYKIKKFPINGLSCYACEEMKKNIFIVCDNTCIMQIMNLFGKEMSNKYVIINKHFRGVYKITEDILLFSSNKVLNNGADYLKFYNVAQNKFFIEIRNYSFIATTNGLLLIKSKKNNFSIVLCACKKYLKYQKNGILLVNPQIQDNKQVDDPFYPTDYFEVYCFCELDTKELGINLILVGGFDNRKKRGGVRLYKIIFDADKANETKLEYILDLNLDEQQESDEKPEFSGPITSIIQSNYDKNILMTCEDGTVNLFSIPNLEFFWSKNGNEKNVNVVYYK